MTLARGALKSLGLHKHHPFYLAWCNMKTRCDNPNSTQYSWYGGRGIRYCESWKNFESFFADMREDWREGLMLDRLDGNGDYFKENCRWVSAKESALNRSSTKLAAEDLQQICRLWESRRYTQTKLASMFGVSNGYIWHILDKAGLL